MATTYLDSGLSQRWEPGKRKGQTDLEISTFPFLPYTPEVSCPGVILYTIYHPQAGACTGSPTILCWEILSAVILGLDHVRRF